MTTVLGARSGPRGQSSGDADLEREEHRRLLLAIVDSFDPAPDVRAEVLRWMDVEQIRAWRALLSRWHELHGGSRRARGRPRNLEAADLARGCARAWQRLSGEMPPKSKADDKPDKPDGEARYGDMVEEAFALAGVRGWHKHGYQAAQRVADESEEQRPSLPGGWAVVRTSGDVGLTADDLRAMGVFWTPPRPRRGRKAKKLDFRP